MSSKRIHYNAAFKRKVIVYAEEHGNRAAGRKFDINEVNIRRWRNNRNALFSCKATTKCFRGPKKGRYPEIDEAVLQFVVEGRAKGLPITREKIQFKALESFKTLGMDGNFKATRGWCERFMRRVGLSLRRRTSICQKLPSDFEQKLLNFQRHVIQLRKKSIYDFKHIGNADETPVFFDMPRNYTVNMKGAKEVKIMSAGYEKQRVTVMLCITADGNKLPPYLILNRKTIPKNEVFPKDVVVRAQKNGWMTNELMEDWVKIIWNKRPGALRNPSSILILDAFRGHLTDNIKSNLAHKNTDLVIIPGGMTSQLQPLDVSINKPFKDYLKKEYESWLWMDNHPLTPSGKIKKAPASKLAEWVSNAWNKISNSVVEDSFKKCCITNALDGSEDDILWENNESTKSESESDGSSDDQSELTKSESEDDGSSDDESV